MLHISEHDHVTPLDNVGHDEGILHDKMTCGMGYFTNNIKTTKYDDVDKRHLIKVGGIAIAYTDEYIRYNTSPLYNRAGSFSDIFSQLKKG